MHVGRTCGPRLLKCTTKEFSAFEKQEKIDARKQAQAWFSGRDSVKAFRAKLNEINGGVRLTLAERMAILTPLDDAVSEDRKEAQRLFPLIGDAFLYD